jgi:uncharacterized protein YbjT (DUF2867 family)
MARVLIAGATGYLGGYVAREFKAGGHWVRALARSPEKLDHQRDSMDEVVLGQVTHPDTLRQVCDGIEVVFSSLGITKQKGNLTFRDVDYQGNLNLLREAQKAGVRKFIYVSVFNGPRLPQLAIVKAHEDFAAALKESGLGYSILRPTGYFSDMGSFLNMAAKGRVYLMGSGQSRMNPIHGADLAVCCVDALEAGNQEIDIGGPQVLSYLDIARLAFSSLNKPPRITTVPLWTVSSLLKGLRLFNHHQAELLAFFTTMMTSDMVAPSSGAHLLSDHFRDLANLHLSAKGG